MAFTPEELVQIAEAVWRWDGIAAPVREADRATNPTWAPRSFLPRLLDGVDELRGESPADLSVLAAEVAELKALILAKLP